MNAFSYIKSLSYLPSSREGRKVGRPSNSEIRRWLVNKSVLINGVYPLPDDEISSQITQLVFFPKGRTVTMLGETPFLNKNPRTKTKGPSRTEKKSVQVKRQRSYYETEVKKNES